METQDIQGTGEALRLFLNDCREARRYEDNVLLRRSVEVWRTLAEAAKVIRENVPPSHERSTAFSFLDEIGMLCSEAIVHGAENDR
jgi:hypothetical protein